MNLLFARITTYSRGPVFLTQTRYVCTSVCSYTTTTHISSVDIQLADDVNCKLFDVTKVFSLNAARCVDEKDHIQ